MRRTFLAVLTFVVAVTSATVFLSNDKAAASVENIISDATFINENAMNEGQIAAFINRFPRSCLLPQNYPQGLSPISFIEPNSYFDHGTQQASAARIINKMSKYYHVNPQVILTTLEKEQALVSGSQGCATWRYNSAMGYNCPDGSENSLKSYPELGIYNTCVKNPGNAGFARQVNRAAWQLRFDQERAYGNLSWGGDGNVYYYGRMTEGWRSRQQGQPAAYYDGIISIGGRSFKVANGATAALYNYTPHFNSFERIFTAWFGSTQLGGSIDMLKASQDIEKVYNSYRDKLGAIRTSKIPEFDSSPRVWQTFDNGTIIWTESTGAHVILFGDVFNRWKQLGGSTGILGVPTGEAVTEGSDNRTWQTFRSGIIIHSSQTGVWDLQNGPIFNKWRESGGSLGQLGKPTSGVIISNTMRKQNFERGSIVRRNSSSPTYIVKDNIHKTWSTSENQSILKVPTGDQVIESDGRIWQYFDGGLAMQIGDSVYIIESGVFHNTWKSAGGSNGSLGKPTSNKTTESGRSWQTFERGIILRKQNSSAGYAMYYGEVYNRWRQTGGGNGTLGLPTSNMYNESDDRTWQAFEQGYIISSKTTGAWDIVGGFYTFWKSQGGSLGKLGKPTSSRNIESDGTRWQTFERGKAVWSPTKGWSITGA